jgi:sugar O-acyltransferase (sialic acid O-acetyltransferase NeuD family)
MKVLIVGAGGHGQVVADILLARVKSGDLDVQPIGFLDDDPALLARTFLGLPVLGRIAQASSIPHDAVVVAIGDNLTRQTISLQLESQGKRFAAAVHPSAVVGSDVEIGAGTMVCAGAVVNPGARVGRGVILNTACSVDHHNYVGDYAHIAPGARLGGDVCIGQGALIGLGAGVLPGRQVGTWATVGAGAIVTRDVPDRTTVVGAPARAITREGK